jgi:hypothetical protein
MKGIVNMLFVFVTILLSPQNSNAQNQTIFFDFENESLSNIQAGGTTLKFSEVETPKVLDVTTSTSTNWPGITFTPESGNWDFSGYQKISVDVYK